MKLVRFGPKGEERPGLWKDDGLVDLRQLFPDIPDIGPLFFKGNWIERLRDVTVPGRPFEGRFGCPIHSPSKIICLGRNYPEHAKEGGSENPKKPLLFCKAPSALTGPRDPILLPRSSGQVDWEVELAIVIDREAKRLSRANALDYIAGFTVMNDVSAREAQFSDSQWFRGKSFDSFAPMGPILITPDEIPRLADMRLTASVNGSLMQDGVSGSMLFDIPTILEYASEDITLFPGDVISTGTPSGVGIFRHPPVLLKAGDQVECRIEGIGSLHNTVLAPEP